MQKLVMTEQLEIVITIKVKALHISIDRNHKAMGIRVIWSRGKKQAKTQTNYAEDDLKSIQFDEEFTIHTLLEVDKRTGIPCINKPSRFSICLDKQHSGIELAFADFNISDLVLNEFKKHKVFVK